MNVLLIDDEPLVLQGLRRMLFEHDVPWDVECVQGGAQALEMLDRRSFEVIVSDMRMPGMDGAVLLERVAERYPNTLRFVLTGQAESLAMARARRAAHHVFGKPCDVEQLVYMVHRTVALRERLREPSLLRLLKGIEAPWPSEALMPVLTLEQPSCMGVEENLLPILIEEELSGEFASVAVQLRPELAGLVLRDQVEHFHRRKAASMALVADLFRKGGVAGRKLGEQLEAARRAAVRAGLVAERLVRGSELAGDAFWVGALMDVGEIVLGRPDAVEGKSASGAKDGPTWSMDERPVSGWEHAEVGAALLLGWGAPFDVVAAVEGHHRGEAGEYENVGLEGLLRRVAEYLAQESAQDHDQVGRQPGSGMTEAMGGEP